LALHGIPEPLTDPIVVRGRRVRIPACRHGQDSWDASEVWLEKTAEGYEVRERSLDAEMPGGQPSDSGFRTARALGTTRVANLMEDAKTTGRWYVVVAMGRHAGHLALGIGKAAGATVTLIREEFGVKPATRVPFSRICDIVEAAILKRLASGRRDGVAMLAEGLVELLSEEDQKRVGKPAYGAYGELRMGELDLGWGVKDEMTKRFEERKQELTVVRKDIGCEFRKRYGVIV
jgi:6-phosphofructokinase 1